MGQINFNTSQFFRNITKPKFGVSEETKQVFKLGNEIKEIKKVTAYIKEYGKTPPQPPNFFKRLNIV